MAEKNTRDEARVLLKKITEFNVANNYYQKEEKEEIARDLKKLLFVDDPTVRKFLEKWLSSTKEIAFEYDLMGTKPEVEEHEEETEEEETEEKEEDEEEEQKEEKEEVEEEKPAEAPTEEAPAESEAPTQEQEVAALESTVYESYINEVNDLLL